MKVLEFHHWFPPNDNILLNHSIISLSIKTKKLTLVYHSINCRPYVDFTSLISLKTSLTLFRHWQYILCSIYIVYCSFKLMAKLSGNYNFYIVSAPEFVQHPLLSTSPPGGTFVTFNEPTLIHYYHSKSIMYIRVYSVFTFYGFWQMNNDIYSSYKIVALPEKSSVFCSFPYSQSQATTDL